MKTEKEKIEELEKELKSLQAEIDEETKRYFDALDLIILYKRDMEKIYKKITKLKGEKL